MGVPIIQPVIAGHIKSIIYNVRSNKPANMLYAIKWLRILNTFTVKSVLFIGQLILWEGQSFNSNPNNINIECNIFSF